MERVIPIQRIGQFWSDTEAAKRTLLRARNTHRSETVAADAFEPRRISLASSILLAEAPAGHISTMASSTEASRRLQRSRMAASKRMLRSFGISSSILPEVVVNLRLQWPEQ